MDLIEIRIQTFNAGFFAVHGSAKKAVRKGSVNRIRRERGFAKGIVNGCRWFVLCRVFRFGFADIARSIASANLRASRAL